MSELKFDFTNCTNSFRREMASNIAEFDEEDSEPVCGVEHPNDLAVDLIAFPPSKYNENKWTYAFWCAKWNGYDWDGTYAEEILGFEPKFNVDWFDENWEEKVKEVLTMVWETVYVKRIENTRDAEYKIYKRIQKQNDLDDAQAIYEDIREDDMPERLPDDLAEESVRKFRHGHDWTLSDYDQLRAYVEEAIKKLPKKGHSFHDDVDKMIDFFHLSREGFLEQYDYLTEADYDATIEQVRQQCDIKETVSEGVALYALIMLRDYKSED